MAFPFGCVPSSAVQYRALRLIYPIIAARNNALTTTASAKNTCKRGKYGSRRKYPHAFIWQIHDRAIVRTSCEHRCGAHQKRLANTKSTHNDDMKLIYFHIPYMRSSREWVWRASSSSSFEWLLGSVFIARLHDIASVYEQCRELCRGATITWQCDKCHRAVIISWTNRARQYRDMSVNGTTPNKSRK